PLAQDGWVRFWTTWTTRLSRNGHYRTWARKWVFTRFICVGLFLIISTARWGNTFGNSVYCERGSYSRLAKELLGKEHPNLGWPIRATLHVCSKTTLASRLENPVDNRRLARHSTRRACAN